MNHPALHISAVAYDSSWRVTNPHAEDGIVLGDLPGRGPTGTAAVGAGVDLRVLKGEKPRTNLACQRERGSGRRSRQDQDQWTLRRARRR